MVFSYRKRFLGALLKRTVGECPNGRSLIRISFFESKFRQLIILLLEKANSFPFAIICVIHKIVHRKVALLAEMFSRLGWSTWFRQTFLKETCYCQNESNTCRMNWHRSVSLLEMRFRQDRLVTRPLSFEPSSSSFNELHCHVLIC